MSIVAAAIVVWFMIMVSLFTVLGRFHKYINRDSTYEASTLYQQTQDEYTPYSYTPSAIVVPFNHKIAV